LSGKKAKAARRAGATEAASTKTGRSVQGPKKYQPATQSRFRRGVWVLLAIPLVVGGLYAVTVLGKGGGGGGGGGRVHGSGDYPYAIGSPGPGDRAPPLTLPSTSGGTFDLATYRGKTQVLLYFQEGLTCQPCWDQLQAIQKDLPKFHALGIGPIVSITTDPIAQIEQKVKDDGITIPVLADVGAEFSNANAWGTNKYQMQMMGERNGHSFILVGKDGRIRWRADYGGAPKYTMFVPDDRLLADLREGIKAQT
jgi:peroxiredoxin Q/BCP